MAHVCTHLPTHPHPPCAGLNLSEQELLRDPELLRAVLQYHVVPERTLTTAQLNSNDRLPTLAPGQLLEVRGQRRTASCHCQPQNNCSCCCCYFPALLP